MFNIRQKLLVFIQFTNNETVEIFQVLHDKVALLTRRRSEQGARNCEETLFRKVWTRYI